MQRLKKSQMATELTIKIPGKPQSWQAHEHGKTKGRKYLPAESREYQERIAKYAKLAMKGLPPIKELCYVETLFVFAAPKKLAPRVAEHRALLERLNAGELLPRRFRPDGDNLISNVWDGIKGIVIEDDDLICDWGGSKRIGKEPMTVVTITEIEK